MLILSDKLLLDIQLIHTFMPNTIHKPWMVSSGYRYSVKKKMNLIFFVCLKINVLDYSNAG